MKDIMGRMKQVGQMQARLKEMQDELGRAEIEGQSGGGLVRLTVDGKGEVKRISIDPSLMKVDEIEILEDLIVAAAADARSKSDSAMQAKMAEITGGLPLPPGIKLF
jgi:DNA-binding YbaB/EbfC family protein